MATRHPAPRFGPLAVGGYVAITSGVLAGGHGDIEAVSVEDDTLSIRLGTDNLATVPQANAEPTPRPGSERADPHWVRVEDGHPRWEISNPAGDGQDYLCTDAVISAYGRAHVERVILRGLPPLPECAWAAAQPPGA